MENKVSNNFIQNLIFNIINDGIKKIVVGAVILRSDNSILLLKRASDDFMGGLVELPSGTVDKNEEILDSLVREVKEETGLDISLIIKFISSFDYISSSGKKTRQLSFLVETAEQEVKLNELEHSEYYWVKIEDKLYASLNISHETRKTIEYPLAYKA